MAETKCKRGFQSHVMCDCEPTHPLTPREKVAVFESCPGCGADEPRNRCLGCSHDFAPHNRQAILDGSPVTALASSGDHAEMARLADDLRKFEHHAIGSLKIDINEVRRIIAACDAHTALLAENAALRGANTEAERKLAEAVELNDRAAELMRQCTDPERFEGVSTLAVYANMRVWLSDPSKEAERG